MDEFLQRMFPFWRSLSPQNREQVNRTLIHNCIPKGTVLYQDSSSCTGLMLLKSGQMRVFSSSGEGGQITLFRLVGEDICILSAACMIEQMDFAVSMEFESDSEVYVVPKSTYQQLNERYSAVKEFTLQLISSRFSHVMWLMNQLVFLGTGQRLAQSLMELSRLQNSASLTITHDQLARDLGTAREVVTRLLKHFQLEGFVTLSRGSIQIVDPLRLSKV